MQRHTSNPAASHTASSDSAGSPELFYWRGKSLNTLYIIGISTGMLTLAPSVLYLIEEKMYTILGLDLVVIAWGVAAVLFRHRIRYSAKAVGAAACIYLLGLLITVKLGPFSGGMFWLFGFPLAAALLLGLKAVVAALVLNAATLAMIGWLMTRNVFPWAIGESDLLLRWVILCANFLMLNALIGISVAVLTRGMESAIRREYRISRKFSEEHDRLNEAFRQLKEETGSRLQAEDALRLSEARYRHLAEHANDNIWVLSLDKMKPMYTSPSIKTLLGYTPEEALAMDISDLLTPESLDLALGALKEELARDSWDGVDPARSRTMVMQQVHKDGSIVWVEIALTFFRDENGRPTEIMGVGRDVTERIKAEEERKQLERQLNHARKMEAVGTLAGGISHDFNNILQIISGYTQLLYQTEHTDPGAADYLRNIDAAVERASSLVQRLLTFSRKVEPQLSPADLNREIRHTVSILQHTIPKMIRLEMQLADDLKAVDADIHQIGQVLMNLSANARDAMPEGGVLSFHSENIHLAALTAEGADIPPGDYVRLTVSDTGQGMDEKTLKHIFDPFFTTKEIGRGTGLGLSTAYGIVKNHGGRIRCVSRIGEGTRFIIDFPVSTAHGAVAVNPPAETDTMPDGAARILLVDDEISIRETISEILAEYGFTVETASSGEEAVSLFSAGPDVFNLVILDLGMPGMGGRRALNELLAINPAARVIVATGYSPSGRDDILDAGAKAFIGKPYKMASLLTTIRQVLSDGDGEPGTPSGQ